MSKAPSVTKPRGSRLGSLVGSKAPTLIRRDLRVASGSRGFEPCQYLVSYILLFTAAGLTAALSMTFQHTARRPLHMLSLSGGCRTCCRGAGRRPPQLLLLCGGRLPCCHFAAAAARGPARRPPHLSMRCGSRPWCGCTAAAARLGYRCGRRLYGHGAATAAHVVAQRRPPHGLLWSGTAAATLAAAVRRPPPLLSLRGRRRTWSGAAAATLVDALRQSPLV